jgi:catechol 2,3-dioxygenase-like lactoylglutathione lyase family enzyme
MTGKIAIKSLDHIVLSVRSIPKTIEFYTKLLGMRHEVFQARKDQERYVTELQDATPQPSLALPTFGSLRLSLPRSSN